MPVDPGDVARRDRDRALIEAHCAGDETAFPVIVREHYRALLAQAHHRLGNPVEAEDAVQEAFERAYRGLCRLNGDYRIGAWLSRILTNVCIDHAVRRQRQRALLERIGRRHTTSPDVAEQSSDPVVVRAVRAALDALPPAQRQTFWLYEMDGLSYPEVAQQLGISEDNARARVHRAKSALRRTLARARDAVAAIVAVPAALRALTRHGKKLSGLANSGVNNGSASLSRGSELAQSTVTAAPGLHASVAQAAYALNAGPVADLAASAASGGPNALVVMVASVATAIGGALAVPAVTGSSGSPGDASAAVAAVPPDPVPLADLQLSATAPVTTTLGTTATSGPPVTATTTPTKSWGVEWITAGAEADGDPWASSETPASGTTPVTRPAVDPCPWLASYPDIVASRPGKAPVLGTIDPAETTIDPGLSFTLSTATTLRLADEPGGPVTTTIPVVIRAQVCLARGESALVADVSAEDGRRVQLRGLLVMQLNDGYFLFRGSVSRPAGAPGLSLPWGLGDRFVAQLEYSPGTRVATLGVAFLGGARSMPPTTPTTSPEPPTPTTAPPAPGDTPPTTSPEPPGPSTTTPTTAPTTTTTSPPSTGDGSPSSGSSP